MTSCCRQQCTAPPDLDSQISSSWTGQFCQVRSGKLDGVHQTSVGTELYLVHDLLDLYEVGDVHVGSVGNVLVGWIKIDDGHLPAQ